MRWKVGEDCPLPRISKSLFGRDDAESQLWGWKLILGSKSRKGKWWVRGADSRPWEDRGVSGLRAGASQLEPVLQNLPTLLQIPPLHLILPKVQRWKELAFPLLLGGLKSEILHLTPFNTVKVAQSCLTLCGPMNYTVHGIFQARVLEWVAISFCRGILPTQGSNPGLSRCRQILYRLSHQGIPSFQVVLVVKNWPANAGDIKDGGSIPESGRSPGGGHDSPLQCSCLENPMDRRAWWALVRGVAKSLTRLKWFSMPLNKV